MRGSAEFASDYDGPIYYFVSQDARDAFDADPCKYLPAFGGWCALGMSVDDKFPVDPRRFKIVKGRLMLFRRNSSVDPLDLWNQGEQGELVTRADAHWRKVQGCMTLQDRVGRGGADETSPRSVEHRGTSASRPRPGGQPISVMLVVE